MLIINVGLKVYSFLLFMKGSIILDEVFLIFINYVSSNILNFQRMKYFVLSFFLLVNSVLLLVLQLVIIILKEVCFCYGLGLLQLLLYLGDYDGVGLKLVVSDLIFFNMF